MGDVDHFSHSRRLGGLFDSQVSAYTYSVTSDSDTKNLVSRSRRMGKGDSRAHHLHHRKPLMGTLRFAHPTECVMAPLADNG